MDPQRDSGSGQAVPPGVLVVAGEASGDLHAARMLEELKGLRPDVTAFGMGGPELTAAGLEVLHASSEISVVGIAEALKIVPTARRIFRDLLAEVDRRGTRCAVLVDSPEFNLRLAAALHSRGVRVVYYVSPQVWAWRRGRVRTIRRVVDRMLVLFPFEVEFYRRHGVEVEHVGHPLVDEVPTLPGAWDGGVPRRFRVALLPGSRASEVAANAPTLLAAARELAARLPVDVVWVRAPGLPATGVEERIESAGLRCEVVSGDRGRFEVLASCHLALCASGTATLEVGLLGTPLIVVYKVHRWTHALGRVMVRLPHISLVNLVLEKEAVPELVQKHAAPGRIVAEAEAILTDGSRRDAMLRDLKALRARLGVGGASRRAAEAVRLELEAVL